MLFPNLNILGVMSGSSLDGLDLAICSFQFNKVTNKIEFEIKEWDTVSFENEMVTLLKKAYTCSSQDIFSTQQIFTDFCVNRIGSFLGKSDIKVDAISFHGHTLFHEPANGYSVQLGNSQSLAQRTGIDVISDFRNNDIALNGQGAPLAPIVERYLFPEHHLFLNLGGIANIGIHIENDVKAFDITACNQALNHLANQIDLDYDNKGRIAQKGHLLNSLYTELNELSFHHLPPPKSLSNTWVQKEYISKLDASNANIEDKMYTVVQVIANQIHRSLESFDLSGTVLVSGGGVHNDFLIKCIDNQLSPIGVTCTLPSGHIADSKEALLMAFMAYLRINEKPNCLYTVTGASRDSCGGVIYSASL
jgi:anhydro-N-acetylmuramic acid kinase